MAASLPRIASVTPSAKYSWSAPPRFSNGSTATTRLPSAPAAGARWLRCQISIPIVAVTSRPSTNASAAGTRCGGRAAGGDAAGSVATVVSVRGASPGSSARTKSAADANRSAGTRASALATARSTGSGTLGRCWRTGGASSSTRRASSACAVAPVKGGSPASIS